MKLKDLREKNKQILERSQNLQERTRFSVVDDSLPQGRFSVVVILL